MEQQEHRDDSQQRTVTTINPERVIRLADGVVTYTTAREASEFQALRKLPPQTEVVFDLYTLCQNGGILTGFIETDVYPVLRALFDEHPVVQNYHAHVSGVGRLLENITMLFSKLVDMREARTWLWGRAECIRDDRMFLYFLSALDRVHRALRSPLCTIVHYPHVLEHPYPSDYLLLRKLKEVYDKLVNIDQKIFKYVHVAEELEAKRQILLKEEEMQREEEEEALYRDDPDQAMDESRRSRYRSAALEKLCGNERRAEGLQLLRQRVEESKRMRELYKRVQA